MRIQRRQSVVACPAISPRRSPSRRVVSGAWEGRRRAAWALVLSAWAWGCVERDESHAADFKVVARFGEGGRSPGQFVKPRAIDTDGRWLYVIDMTARVQRIDPETGRCTAWWQLPDFEFGRPVGVTVGPWTDGSKVLYIPETHYHRVSVFRLPEGMGRPPEMLLRFGEYGRGPGQFIFPTDVAVLPGADGRAERIYVSEYGGHDRVSVFDPRGTFLFAFGTFGPEGVDETGGGISFNRPQSIAIEPTRRELVVCDAANHRLGRFTLEGGLLGWIGSPASAGSGPGQFKYPYGLALPGDGTALVCEYGNGRVQRVDLATGASLGVYGRAGRGESQSASPWGLALVGRRMFVLDSGHHRVLAVESPGGRGGGA